LLDTALSNRVAAAMQTERTTVELLGNLYTAFANAYLSNRNVSMLMTSFVPLAEKLEETIEDSSKIIEDCLNQLPRQALADSTPVTPCPLPMEEKSDQIFTWKDGQFYRNGEPDFIVIYGGIEMYCPYPRSAQFNKIRRAQPMPWGVVDRWDSSKEFTEKGKYIGGLDWTWYPGDLRRGPVKVLPYHSQCIPVPKWWLDANRDDKDILMNDRSGRYVAPQRQDEVAVNIWNPKVRDMKSNTCEQVALWYKTKALYYVLGHEMGGFPRSGYNDSARQEFRSFLEKEYQSIDSLNTKWITNYTSFAEINPPIHPLIHPPVSVGDSVGLRCEFQRFRDEGLKQWMLLQRAALQKATPEVPTMIDFHCLLGGANFDMPYLFESCDIISFHIYDNDDRNFKYCNRWLDSLRKVYGNTLGNIEFAPNMCCPDFYDEDIYKNNMLQQTFHMMMWGQGIPNYWAFIGASWSDGYSVCDQRYAMMIMRYMGSYAALAVDRIRRFGRIALQADTVPPDAGILEATSSWYVELNRSGIGKVRLGMQAAALELENAGVNYGFLYEKLLMEGRQNLKTIQAIIVPNGFCMDKKLQDILIPWVKGGGMLICYGAPGVVNSYGQPDGRLLGMAFPGTTWEGKPNEWVPADTNSALQSVACGAAKIYEGKIGKGKLVLFSSRDVDKDMRRKTLEIVRNNVRQGFWCRDNKFDLVLREKDKVKFMYILNSSLKETADDEILVKGRFEKITDKGLQCPMVIPAQYADGFTTFKMHLAPAEGTLLVLY